MEDKKESYLSKLKSIIKQHISDIISKDIEEYKGNMEMKHDMSVASKEQIVNTVQNMITFNNSSKVSEKIKATKDELVSVFKDVKEQVLAVLKGGKSKYDDDQLTDFFDEVEDNIEESGVAVESISSLRSNNDSVDIVDDSNTHYPEESEYVDVAFSAAALIFSLAYINNKSDDSFRNEYVRFVDENPNYIHELLNTLKKSKDNSENESEVQPTRNDLLVDKVLDPEEPQVITLEDDEILSDIAIENIELEIENIPVSSLPRHEYSDSKYEAVNTLVEKCRDIEKFSINSLNENKVIFNKFNDYIGEVVKVLIKDVNINVLTIQDQNLIDSNLHLTFHFISEYILKEYNLDDEFKLTSYNIFCASLLNVLENEVYDNMNNLSNEIIDNILKKGENHE